MRRVTGPGLVAVAAGGVLGSLARFAIEQSAPLVHGSIWATFAVNVLGCLAIGIVISLLQSSSSFPSSFSARSSPLLHLFLVTGVLGGFTTFSAFAAEVVLTADGQGQGGSAGLALLYMGATLLVGLLAVPLGVRVAATLRGGGAR